MIAAKRPSFEELREALSPRLANALAASTGFGSVHPLTKKFAERSDLAVTDGVEKWLVRGNNHRPAAVVLVSSPNATGLVARGMQRAREAKMLLGPLLGQVILTPICEGEVASLSFAALPYCQPLATSRLMAMMQRRRLRGVVLEWLRDATSTTVQDTPGDRVEAEFVRPLKKLCDDAALPESFRTTAREALDRLEAGRWLPKHVLMHNDLWLGNLLIDNRNVTGRAGRPWAERFVIIDWPGAAIEGYGMYDLLRFAQTMKLSGEGLREEVGAHCAILGCEPIDARSHLMAALGYLLLHIEHFPKPAFVRTAMSCLWTLESVVSTVASGEQRGLSSPRREVVA